MAIMFNDAENRFIREILLCNNELSRAPYMKYEGCFCAPYYALVTKRMTASLADTKGIISEYIEDIVYQIVKFAHSTYVNSVYKYELKLAIENNLLRGHDLSGQEHYFVNTLSRSNEWLRYFFEKYPNLTYLLDIYTSRIINFITKFSREYEEERSQLADLFALGNATIKKIKLFCGDVHDGKCVMSVDFSSGRKIYYKPRNAENERFLECYIHFLCSLGLNVKLTIPKFKNNRDHSWHLHQSGGLEIKELKDLDAFYRNWGILLCIFYFLNSQDIIPDNVVCSDQQPCIIDCEALINLPIPYCDGTLLLQYMQNSVIKSGILPDWMFSNIEERNRISSVLFKFNAENLHLPRYEDESIPISRDLSLVFLDGFKKAYHFMLTHKKLILDFFASYNFQTITSRVLLHPTIIYTFLLKEYTTPEYLSGAKHLDDLLSTLVTDTAFGKYRQKIIFSILEQIKKGDIPYFYTHLGTSVLSANQRTFIKEWLDGQENILTFLSKKIRTASYIDCCNQCNIIRETLRFFLDVTEDDNHTVQLKPSKLTNFVQDAFDILDAVQQIAQRITTNSIEIGDEIGFMGRTKNIYDGIFQVGLMNNSIYGGLAGLCIFYRTLYTYVKNGEYFRLAHKLFTQLCSNYMDSLDVKDHLVPISPLSGMTGILYIMELFPNDFYDKSIYNDIVERVKELIPVTIQFDYMSGLTGLILFIKQCKLMNACDKRFLMRSSGYRLLDLAINKGEMLCWTYRDGVLGKEEQLILGGFSHGTSSVAIAFRILYQEFSDISFKVAYQKALLHDRSFYDPDIKGWRDGREYINNQDTGSWCHGAAGIALSRIMLYPTLENDLFICKELEIAEPQVIKRLGYNLSMCHGTMGNIEVLKGIDSALYGGYKHENRIKEWLNSIIKLIKCGDRILCGDDNFDSQLSLFMGYAGIGYQLLRMYDWKNVPSMLCLETHPFIHYLHN